jgi:hypothetical protein
VVGKEGRMIQEQKCIVYLESGLQSVVLQRLAGSRVPKRCLRDGG